MHSGAIADIAGVVQHCEDALTQAEDEAGLQAKHAVIGIAGELVKGTTSTIRYRRPQPDRPLDEQEVEFIIEKVQDRAAKRAQKQIALETGNDEVEVKLVNSALVSMDTGIDLEKLLPVCEHFKKVREKYKALLPAVADVYLDRKSVV